MFGFCFAVYLFAVCIAFAGIGGRCVPVLECEFAKPHFQKGCMDVHF